MEWISVKDRVPDKSGEYLVTETFDESVIILFAEWDSKFKEFIDQAGHQYIADVSDEKGSIFYDDVMAERITAWMPLPEPYDEEGEDEDGGNE